jgi:hypothetical protein
VLLTVAQPAMGTVYTVTVNGLQDTSGNIIAPNSKLNFVSFSLVTKGVLEVCPLWKY